MYTVQARGSARQSRVVGAEAPHASPGGPNCASGGGANPAALTLVVNEVMANPLDEDTGEFVELFNDGEAPVEAAGLLLDDGDAVDALEGMVPGRSEIPAGGYAVVIDPEHAGDYVFPEGTVLLRPDDTTLGSGLATNDVVTLRAGDGVTVVSTFGHPFNPGNGVSVERVDDSGDVAGNWLASSCPSGSSPGRANCVSDGGGVVPGDHDLVINEVLANPLVESTGEFVEILNLGDSPVDLADFVISDGDAVDRIEGFEGGPTDVPPGGFAVVLDRDYPGVYEIPAAAVRLTVDDRTIGSGLATSDPITLLQPDGISVVDTFTHPFNPGNGRSAERVDPGVGDVLANWVAASCEGEQRSSPGAPNCAAGGAVDPEGQRVDVNVADPGELAQIRGIGAVLAGRIVAHREAHGLYEQLHQLTVLTGVTPALVDGWARLEDGEDFYLAIAEDVARERVTFERVADLLAALPDPAAPGAWDGRVVRIQRVVNLTEGDSGRWRRFQLGDWGDTADFRPNGEAQIVAYLGSADRDEVTAIDALGDWIKEDGAPYSDTNFYRWESRLSSGGLIRANHVFAVEGRLQVFDGAWQIGVRTDADAGMDRLVMYER